MNHKLIIIAAAIGAWAALSGCGADGKSSSPRQVNTVATTTDSVVARYPVGTVRYVAEVPSGNTLLRRLVSEWIAERLGGYYEGSYDSIAPILRLAADSAKASTMAYVRELPDEVKKEMAGSSTVNDAFTKVGDGADYVTWSDEGYTYQEGSAHGIAPFSGQTFRKSDGRRIGWEVLRNVDSEGFQRLLRGGLKSYLHVKTDEEVDESFLNEDDRYLIPLPQCPPLFTKDGIRFVYNQYEIFAYAAGIPTFTVSYARLRPYMTATARALVETAR